VDPIMNPYEIAHQQAGLVDRSSRGTVQVTGADRTQFLQGLLTNDIKSLAPSRGCYAAWLTPQGRMITDMCVFVLDERILLDVRAVDASTIGRRLEQLVFSEDVQIQDLTKELTQMRVVGPDSPRALIAALGTLTPQPLPVATEELNHWPEYQSATIPLDDTSVLIVRDDELGVMGFDIHTFGPRHVATAARIRTSLEQHGVVAIDHQTTETLRIEAGRPLFGVDMDEDTIPLEAGIEDRAINFSKGCYVGQEVIVRVTSRGHGRVVRRLVGLRLEGRVPSHGDALFGKERDIGLITSATYSPGLSAPIALGYVHRDFVEPGTPVTVGHDGIATGTVTPLPFRTSG
jgi:folate-binding protein YgfZ